MSNEGGRPGANGRWHLGWAAVLAANLVVPAHFGWLATRDGGRLGLVGAVVLVWAAGHFVLAGAHALGQAVVRGGVVTAVSQLLPILQLVAVVNSVRAVERAPG